MHSELLRILEGCLSPSVAFVAWGDRVVQIGFFVSEEGLLCTCYHGLIQLDPTCLFVSWGAHRRSAVIEEKEGDFALLRVHLPPGVRTVAAPVAVEPFEDGGLPRRAVSLGGRQKSTIRLAVRSFQGSITARYWHGPQERLETLDLSVGSGHSGAPIFDLHTLRVAAYVRSSLPQYSGDALTLGPLRRRRPDLLPIWEAAGDALDGALAPYFQRRSAELDVERCSRRLARSLYDMRGEPRASTLLSDAGGLPLRDVPALDPRLYVERAVVPKIRRFLSTSAARLLLVTGPTGAGKTTLLTALGRGVEPSCTFVLIECRTIHGADLLSGVPGAQPPDRSGMDTLRLLMKREPERTWVLVFDGLNEWPSFDRDAFWAAARAIEVSGDAARPGALKAIFSMRSELLREQFPALYFWKAPRFGAERHATAMFYPDESLGRPYIELAPLGETALEDGRLELDVMYERYREVGVFWRASGVVLGGCPTTTVAQLGQSVRSLLDRPGLLPLFMAAYDRAEVPNLTVRQDLLRKIIDAAFRRVPGWGELPQASWEQCLRDLSLALTLAPPNKTPVYRDLRNRPWHDPTIFQTLLSHTSLLTREARGAAVEDDVLAFREEWLLEYFLSAALWLECLADHVDHGDALDVRLDRLATFCRAVQRADSRTHLLAALVLCAERALAGGGVALEVLVAWINRASASLADSFTHELLDFVRLYGGLGLEGGAPSLSSRPLDRLASLSRLFTAAGAARLLDYGEHLETIGAYRSAMALLALDDSCFAPGGRDARVRRSLCRALCAFYANDSRAAERHISELSRGELSPSEMAKWSFVAGRLHQFDRRYPEAARLFCEGAEGDGLFAARCAHQLAFVKVIASSDFAGALADLDRLVAGMGAWSTPEERLESRLLRAQCALRLGRYGEAEDEIASIVEMRRTQRHGHKLGTALRSLAEVHLRRFERQPALRRSDEGLEVLTQGEHALSRAHVLDVKALALGLLEGDVARALLCTEDALRLSRGVRYDPGTSWYLQTAALLHAIDGREEEAERCVVLAAPERGSPFERLQARFIGALARWIAGRRAGEEWIAQATRLKADFIAARLAWYPGVLSLALLAARGSDPSDVDPSTHFAGAADEEGLRSSHLFGRIFASR